MSAIQPTLQNYFKVKKNSKENFKARKLVKEGICKTGSWNANTSREHSNFDSNQKLSDIKSEDTSTYVAEYHANFDFQKSSLKKEENSLNESTQDDTSKIENEVPCLSVTPNKEATATGVPSRKRKRELPEDDASNQVLHTLSNQRESQTSTLSSKQESGIEIRTPSAKKRLIMEDNHPSKSAPKKLDPETIKKRLGKCGHLDELRLRLLKLNQCEEKLEAFRSQTFKKPQAVMPLSPQKLKVSSPRKRDLRLAASPYKISSPQKNEIPSPCKFNESCLNHFNALDIEVPVSPKKSPSRITTPVKSHPKCSSHLADSSSELYLPHCYQFVKEMFRAVDTVVSLLHNRQEVITFAKLKPAVQEMLRKTFSQTHLGQLKTVFPLAYFFAQEKLKSKNPSTYNIVNYELTVKPNLDYKKDVTVARNLMQDMCQDDLKCSKFRKMDSVVLVERRHIFHSALLEILKKQHDKFLQNLDPPITLQGPLLRWHPEFAIEDVPPPSPSQLPQPPSDDSIDTAKEFLDKAKHIFCVNNRMKEAITTAASGKALVSSSQSSLQSQQTQITDKSQVVAALKGVSLSLLEKIRAREAVKAAREMTRSVGASKELEMLSRLPELVRVLRSLFIAEKKAALPLDTVIAKVISSHSGSLSSNETEMHLNILMEKVPGWCTRHTVRSGIYIKIDKMRQLNEIIDKLNAIIKEKS